MMAELKKYKLGEIAEIYNGSTPSTFDSSNYDGDIIWATPKDLSDQNSKYFSQGARNITQKGFDSCSTQMISANNILMSSRAPIGLFAINTVDCCTNQGFKNIVLDKSIADVDFMYYFLKYHVKEIEALGSGTTFREVSKTAFEKYEISIPALPIQQKISAILSNIDRKISVNREINRNLEELAKQIYDYWFVQFDFPNEDGKPYKSSGGKMVWDELLKREIPSGWEAGILDEIIEIKRGKTITEKQTTSGTIKVVAAGLTYSYFHGESNRTANCITVSGSGENAGFVNFWREPIFASDCSTIQFESEIDTIFCYYTLKKHEKRFYQISHKSGQPHILPSDIGEIPMVFPSKSIKDKTASFFINANKQIAENTRELELLFVLRDTLLPLLMNGQVTLNSCLSHD